MSTSTPVTIRPAQNTDATTIEAIAVAAGMFTPEEATMLGEMLEASQSETLGGETGPEAYWLVAQDAAGELLGAAYVSVEPFADRMWNLYFIAVQPSHQGTGVGTHLMRHVEKTLCGRGSDAARTLVVETSSTEQYARTRQFYRGLGYDEEARIRQFYGPNDDKIVFWKCLA